ncbi:MAG: hypothetical protein KH452_13075 [Clostridiales bacterium]|nr:hypothetical protein [Clostridiales bacterium]
MKKRNLFAIGIVTVFLLTGCQQNNSGNAETEELKQQIAQLEQQVASLEQESTASVQNPDAAAQTEVPPSDDTSADTDTGTETSTSYSMEELTEMVSAFEAKAEGAAPSGTEADDIETFFTLKKEENQIDNALDRHEDELERQYRDGILTRDEYKAAERELEDLEDRLDKTEDGLERTFGIDD